MNEEDKTKLEMFKNMTFGERLIYAMNEVLDDIKGKKKLRRHKIEKK